MRNLFQSILYYLLYGLCYTLSLLPFRVLYVLSDGLYYILYYVGRYRRRVVRTNLTNSFPEKNIDEIKRIEKKFYSMLCDYFFESVKLASISKKEILKRMRFEGLERVNELAEEGRSAAFFLAHTFNWEWIVSFPLHIRNKQVVCGQIYHRLANRAFDRLFLRLRNRFGTVSIPMAETARTLISYEKEKTTAIFGFIADQSPKWNMMGHWIPFLNQETPVITGTEHIIKRLNNVAVFCSLVNVKRGYYVCRIERIIEETKNIPNYKLTDMYYEYLEASIRQNPSSWLWTHKRWKWTKASVEQYKQERTK